MHHEQHKNRAQTHKACLSFLTTHPSCPRPHNKPPPPPLIRVRVYEADHNLAPQPYKVSTDVGFVPGTQLGYNICNSATRNQEELCQTAWTADFCLWAPAEDAKDVGSVEGSMIAWYTKPCHGTRLILEDALSGVRLPDYVQVVGFIDQTKINILECDYGGEMDPPGADLVGSMLL